MELAIKVRYSWAKFRKLMHVFLQAAASSPAGLFLVRPHLVQMTYE